MNIYTYLVDIDVYQQNCTIRKQVETKAKGKLDAVRKIISLHRFVVKLWSVDRIK